MDVTINVKFLEILMNIVYEQNRQLLQIIAETEELSYRDVMRLLPSPYEIKKSILSMDHAPRVLPEKSNSISESSDSYSDPEVE